MSMTANEMLPAIGAKILVRFESLQVFCNVLDVKHVYGRIRLQVEPANGHGAQWIELSRVIPAFECCPYHRSGGTARNSCGLDIARV